jgi:hypothetical protein
MPKLGEIEDRKPAVAEAYFDQLRRVRAQHFASGIVRPSMR